MQCVQWRVSKPLWRKAIYLWIPLDQRGFFLFCLCCFLKKEDEATCCLISLNFPRLAWAFQFYRKKVLVCCDFLIVNSQFISGSLRILSSINILIFKFFSSCLHYIYRLGFNFECSPNLIQNHRKFPWRTYSTVPLLVATFEFSIDWRIF